MREEIVGYLMSDDQHIRALAASELVSAATLSSLVGMLGAKGILSDEEVREIYEQALYLLQQQQSIDAETATIYDVAREVIEAQLR
jgi:hypothetical protein